jgi:hypothetical protein
MGRTLERAEAVMGSVTGSRSAQMSASLHRARLRTIVERVVSRRRDALHNYGDIALTDSLTVECRESQVCL